MRARRRALSDDLDNTTVGELQVLEVGGKHCAAIAEVDRDRTVVVVDNGGVRAGDSGIEVDEQVDAAASHHRVLPAVGREQEKIGT